MVKGDIGDSESSPRADNGKNSRIVLRIRREHHRDDLRFAAKPFREKRSNRTVDQTTSENFFFRGTAFALNKAARKLAGGVRIFAVIDGKRKEASSGLWLLGRARGD